MERTTLNIIDEVGHFPIDAESQLLPAHLLPLWTEFADPEVQQAACRLGETFVSPGVATMIHRLISPAGIVSLKGDPFHPRENRLTDHKPMSTPLAAPDQPQEWPTQPVMTLRP